MMNRHFSTRVITEGAMLTAVFVLFAFLSYYTPLGTLLLLVMTAPAAIMTFRHGLVPGIVSVAAGEIVLLLLLDPLYVLLSCTTLQLTGLMLGVATRQKWNPWTTLCAATATTLIGFLLIIWAGSVFMDFDFQKSMLEMYQSASELSLQMVENFNFPEEQLDLIRQIPTIAENMLTNLLPMLLTMSSALNALLNYQVLVVIMRRLKMPVEALPPFPQWRLPDYFGLFFFGSLLCEWLGGAINQTWLVNLAANVYQLIYYIVIIQGMAVVAYFLSRWNSPKVFIWLLLIFLLLNPTLAILLVMLGALDLVLDFRRIGRRPGSPAGGLPAQHDEINAGEEAAPSGDTTASDPDDAKSEPQDDKTTPAK